MEGIIRDKELLKICDSINFVKAKLNISNNYAILDCTVEEFVEFCQQHKISTIFYSYKFYEKEEYLITDDMLKENTENEKAYCFCKQWANTYNAKIQAFDFLRPLGLSLVATFENFIIASTIEDVWLGEDFKDAISALIEFQETHEKELIEFYDFEEDDSFVNPYDELEERLLADKDFRLCTNKEIRRIYMRNFIKLGQNKKYLSLFRDAKTRNDKEYRLAHLFDQIYDEYRRRCYKLKIQVGEPLPNED